MNIWDSPLVYYFIEQQLYQMNVQDKQRQLQYSSLVMGSKSVANSSYPTNRVSHLLSTKTFSKKNELLSSKFSKLKPNRIRTRNQRPDIFLQGEQLSRVQMVFNRQIDPRDLDTFKQRMRRSTPYRTKGDVIKISIQTNSYNQSSASFQEDNSSNIITTQKGAFILRKSLSKNHPSSQPSERQKTVSKEAYKNKQKDVRIKVQNKNQVKRQQSQKIIREQVVQRKQMFYINQKDLNGIKAQSFIVVEYPSNQIVTGYYYKKIVEIASLTKIMTFYTTIRLYTQYNINPEQEYVQIDAKTADTSGTSAELYEGDRYTVMQLLYALMLPSGNDAALALSKWGSSLLSQGDKSFISHMNRLAVQIGMKSTTFGNPHGLPHSQNGCTAQDVSILISKCLQYPIFRQVIKCKEYRCRTQNQGVKREVVWQNTNKLLRRPGFEGVKTGVTATAGPCLATLYNANGRRFIVVLLRTNKLSRRFKQTRWILCMCLRRLNSFGSFKQSLRQLSYNDPELDSDNSQEEQQFNFQKNDIHEFERRRKILQNQL